MKRPAGDEQDVIGLDHTVFGRDSGAFDQWQQVALHALARDIGALRTFARGNFVHFVEEDNAVLFH